MKRRYPSVVSAKPGGTRTPALISSPSEEHFPPTRSTDSFLHSSSQQTIGRPVPGESADILPFRRVLLSLGILTIVSMVMFASLTLVMLAALVMTAISSI